MTDYNAPDLKRINHALKVYGLSRAIAAGENINKSDMEILEAAALLHDIGIHEAEKIYNSSAGKYQELLGPDAAKPLLEGAGFNKSEINRINFIISHHHTYSQKDDMLLRMVMEADIIVNIDEGDFQKGTDYKALKEKIFVTKTGKALIDKLILKKCD